MIGFHAKNLRQNYTLTFVFTNLNFVLHTPDWTFLSLAASLHCVRSETFMFLLGEFAEVGITAGFPFVVFIFVTFFSTPIKFPAACRVYIEIG